MNEITITGSFHRTSDDAHFTYTAKIHQDYKAFSGKIYDARGTLAGTPLVFLTGPLTDAEAACREWIEGCIRDRAGTR